MRARRNRVLYFCKLFVCGVIMLSIEALKFNGLNQRGVKASRQTGVLQATGVRQHNQHTALSL